MPVKEPEKATVVQSGNRNCSQIDSGIGDICTLPLDGSMMHSRFMENGHLNKLAAKPPPSEHFPIKVEDLEDYIMSRRNNNNEELRNEYRELSDFSTEAASSAGELSDNRLKNRFINILPCMFHCSLFCLVTLVYTSFLYGAFAHTYIFVY